MHGEPGEGAPIVVVALGGNALQSPHGDDSVEADFDRTAETAVELAGVAATGLWRVVITHGNGPQVGNHLLRSELAHDHGRLPPLPLDVCVADTQGGMGYMLQQSLTNALHGAGVPAVVTTLVTQVVVDASDPAFDKPSKPIGEVIPASKVLDLQARGWALVEEPHRGGWRRVVPSPDPVEIVEAGAIAALVDDGVVVIAGGGGGVPVAAGDDGALSGVAAVIDKDLASSLLASDLKAEKLVILTDVEFAYRGYGTDHQWPLRSVQVPEARRLLEHGEFSSGSMAPKVEAACRFVETAGRTAAITSIERCSEAIGGEAGTQVVP